MDTCCGTCERPPQEQSPAADPPEGLKEREFQVLVELARDDEFQIGFQGLKRRLGVHQETLRRTLKSLDRMGFVRKREHGYGLTDQAQDVLRGVDVPTDRRSGVPVANLLLPTDLRPDHVVGDLAHRWFEGLRWFGVAHGPGEFVLTWEADASDARVHLRLRLGSASAEVTGCDDEPECLRLAGTVVSALLDTIRSPPDDGVTAAA